MPEMSGKETYERLKEIDPDVKVLLVSGYTMNKQVKELMDMGCNGFIQKPFDILQLSQKIREVLRAGVREVKSMQAQKFEKKD
jgi:DNA-binding NarL/FixJ family response regulator